MQLWVQGGADTVCEDGAVFPARFKEANQAGQKHIGEVKVYMGCIIKIIWSIKEII